MIIVYSNTITSRLSYILRLIFNDLMGIDYQLISNREKFGSNRAQNQLFTGTKAMKC